jgi:microcin C transport system ATP-binding protein
MDALLTIQDLSFSLGERPLLRGVNLKLAAGEKLALVGASGSGKSLLAKMILGLEPQGQKSGEIIFNGENLANYSAVQWQRLRGRHIAMIFQDPSQALNPLQPIGKQLIEPLQWHLGLSRQEAEAQVKFWLSRVGLQAVRPSWSALLATLPHQLSGGQKQRLLIAQALSCEPQLLLADEPTTALDVTVQKEILNLLLELQSEKQLAVLFISHDLAVVRHFAERLYVLQNGTVVEEGGVVAVLQQPQHAYTRMLCSSFALPPRALPQTILPSPPPCLRVEQVSVRYRMGGAWAGHWQTVLENISFELAAGQTLAVVGESGAGKSTLMQAILQLIPYQGKIFLGNENIAVLAQKSRAWRRRLQVVFQDPFGSLSPRLTIAQTLEEGLRLHFPELSRQERQKRQQQILQDVGLDAAALSRYPHAFSGGERQRIAIARVLLLAPEILILDEPTSSLDAAVQGQVVQLLQLLQKKHSLAYILVTHDLRLVRALADSVLVLAAGRGLEWQPTTALFMAPKRPETQQLLNSALYFDF